ncbi:MAG: flagellar hook assembly protein FlgD [Amphiplicatus sp.]
MLTTNETTPLPGAPTQNRDKASIASATAASDFQSFLKLLTAQLRNQDPLSPLESTQFVQQLASFSAVEQQIETNRLLRDFVGGETGAGLEGAMQWIGKEVETEASTVAYRGEPMEFRIGDSAAGAPSEIVIRNASGEIVLRKPVAAGETRFTWDGKRSDGAAAALGAYKISVDYVKGDEIVDTKPPSLVARVAEARLSEGDLSLVLSNGAVIDPASITAVREAKSDVLPGDV